jgi:hypothetical protein
VEFEYASGRWEGGAEFQNKTRLPGSAVEQSKRSANSLWAAVSGGPRAWAAVGRWRCEERAAGATVEHQQCRVQHDSGWGGGREGGPWQVDGCHSWAH